MRPSGTPSDETPGGGKISRSRPGPVGARSGFASGVLDLSRGSVSVGGSSAMTGSLRGASDRGGATCHFTSSHRCYSINGRPAAVHTRQVPSMDSTRVCRPWDVVGDTRGRKPRRRRRSGVYRLRKGSGLVDATGLRRSVSATSEHRPLRQNRRPEHEPPGHQEVGKFTCSTWRRPCPPSSCHSRIACSVCTERRRGACASDGVDRPDTPHPCNSARHIADRTHSARRPAPSPGSMSPAA